MKKNKVYCPYCGAEARLRPASAVYGENTKAENEDNINYFLENNKDFELANDVYDGNGMKTFFPHKDGTDGFFAAKLVRKDI